MSKTVKAIMRALSGADVEIARLQEKLVTLRSATGVLIEAADAALDRSKPYAELMAARLDYERAKDKVRVASNSTFEQI